MSSRKPKNGQANPHWDFNREKSKQASSGAKSAQTADSRCCAPIITKDKTGVGFGDRGQTNSPKVQLSRNSATIRTVVGKIGGFRWALKKNQFMKAAPI